jgi:hypothetical protein
LNIIINARAKINITEGNLIAAKNLAEANLITVEKQAQGQKYAI